MNAPDKIFILNHEDYSDRRILNAFTEKDDEADIEYIRKDALLELLREKRRAITECSATTERKVAALSVIDFLTDKIESL